MRHFNVKFGFALILIILLAGHAQAWSWNDLFGKNETIVLENLLEIELKAESWNQSPRMMNFINRNMFDQGVDTIEVSIVNGDKILRTYYIVKAQDMKGKAYIAKSIPGNPGVLWKFRPTVDEALDGFDQASKALILLEQKEKSKLEVTKAVMKALYLYYSIDSENVPSMTTIIKNSNCNRCKKALEWAGLL